MILMLAFEDIKNFTIPDRLSIPMILITVIFISFSWGLYEEGLLPGIQYSIAG
jgi:Flp pilus assembly protein protease CpaA